MSGVFFCAGDYCPGLHWRASNTMHPTSCTMRHLNSDEGLRAAAAGRREHGRPITFDVPPEGDHDDST